MKCVIFFASLFFVRAFWKCPADPTLPSTNTYNEFPADGDTSYGPNANCQLKIEVPDKQFAQLMVNADPDIGDSITGSNNYINIDFVNATSNMVVIGPSPFVITIKSTSTSVGTFKIIWSFRDVVFANQKTTTVTKGEQPNIVGTYTLFQGAQTFTSSDGSPLAISTASFGKLDSDNKLTGAFVYQGTQPSAPPIACLYNRIDENLPLKVDSPVTVAYFAQPETFDSGAISVSSWSDVANYAQLKLVYYDNMGIDGRFVVDATNGTAAVMLYQNNDDFDTVMSYILTDISTNVTLYAGGIPLSANQLLWTYGAYPAADNAMPQWVPGKLKTFQLDKGSVSVYTDPKAPATLKARNLLTGFFKSANYPFTDQKQDDSLYFQSDDPLTLALSYVASDAVTTIVVNTTGINGPQTCIFPSGGNNCSLYGTNFRFSSQSTTSPSSGGLINYYFTGNETSTTPKSVGRQGTVIASIATILYCFM